MGRARPERTWAVEGAGGRGHLLDWQLLSAGERVLDVQPKLGARVRLLATRNVNKNDPDYARSVAVAALRSATATAAPARLIRSGGKTAYVREDRILPHLAALHLLLTEPSGEPRRRRRTRRGTDVRHQAAEDVIAYLREQQITLAYGSAGGTLRAGTG